MLVFVPTDIGPDQLRSIKKKLLWMFHYERSDLFIPSIPKAPSRIQCLSEIFTLHILCSLPL